MSFISEYLKLPAFLKFLGIAAFVAAVYFGSGLSRTLGFVGLGLFAAGYFFNKLYK